MRYLHNALLGSIMLTMTGCAIAARTGTVAAAAAAGGALGGPVGAGVGAGVGLLSVEAYQGEVLNGQVREAAFSSPQPIATAWSFLTDIWPWVAIAILIFTPSGQYLFRKAKERFRETKPR